MNNQIQMKRCEFSTIQISSVNDDKLLNIKREESNTSNSISSNTFHLLGDVIINIEDILTIDNESKTKQEIEQCNSISQTQPTFNMINFDTEVPQNCELPRLKASSASSFHSLSQSSSSYSNSFYSVDSMNNISQKRVSVINSDENFINYEIYNPTLQTKSIHYFQQCSNQLLSQLDIINQIQQKQNNLYMQDVQQTINSYINYMNEINNILQQSQVETIIDEKKIQTIHSNKKNILSKFDNSQEYIYSIYILDSNQVYRQVQKGISNKLVSLLYGSQSNYIEQILRFGDHEIFDSASSTCFALSHIQSIISSLQQNNYKTILDQNLRMCNYDGKSIPVNCQSQLYPLSEIIIEQEIPIYSAFIRITQIQYIKNNQIQLGINQSCINSNNTIQFENSHLNEEYLQNCQQFQIKYYGKSSIRKKRYRKTKAQVKQELKYYLSLNALNKKQ